MKEIKAIKNILPFLKIFPWTIPLIIILGIISSIAEFIGIVLIIPILQPLQASTPSVTSNPFLKYLDRLFIDIPGEQRLVVIILCIVAAILIKAIIYYTYLNLSIWLNARITHRLRSQLYQQLMNSNQNFWNNRQSGDLIGTLLRETEAVGFSLQYLIRLIVDLCMILSYGFMLLTISWKFTFFVTIALGIIFLLIRQLTQKSQHISKEQVKINKQVHSLIMEGMNGLKTIQLFRRESFETHRFQQILTKQEYWHLKVSKIANSIDPLFEGLGAVLLAGILLIAINNKISIAVTITFIFMLYRLQPRVKSFDFHRLQVMLRANSVIDVVHLLETSRQESIQSGSIQFSSLKKGIDLQSVTFFYNNQEKPAIDNVSIFLPKGQTIALVGYSGAGKSTIINLIFRFYDVTSGQIFIDDYPLEDLDLASWRRQIAMVSQDIYIFNETIRDNIAYGRPDATEAEILAAAKQAHAEEFILNLPEGYNTYVGEKGIRLSGGQKQRISIARAILCDPEILILDEATNALDSISENLIQDAIKNLSKNRTVIVIAHRLSTIEQADQILVMDSGQVTEIGNFQELIKQNGLFSKLYQLQYK